MSSLPSFNEDGLLPPGDYTLTIAELRQSILVKRNGDENYSANWDSSWRGWLVDQLEMMIGQLWAVGVADIFVNGSFVEDKGHPNDIDGYFECDMNRFASGELQRELNLLDPQKVWTWDPATRQPFRNYPKRQLPMWHVYRVELYPHWGSGPGTGIRDRLGHELTFPSAFRQCRRDGKPKGIIKIVRSNP